MQTERRSAPRRGLNSLVYLDLESGNGGILLNLSEDGMQISVANRLVTSSEIRFTLRLQPSETISGTGRIAWLSPSGRSAGVRFLSLPDEARREIRQWLGGNADTSTAETSDEHEQPEAEPPQMEAPPAMAPLPEPTPAIAVPPPAAPAEEPPTESPAPSEALEMQAAESTATPPQSDAPPHAPVEAAMETEPVPEFGSPEAAAPEPADALELLEATVDTTGMEAAPPAWSPAAMAPCDSLLAGDEESSVLSLYGIDGNEPIEPESRPEQFPDETSWQSPIAAPAGYPQSWAADHPSLHSWSDEESERSYPRIPNDRAGSSHARKARARARRRKAARKHPPILLSPIFVPAPPPSESLPPPDPAKVYKPVAAPAVEPLIEQPPAAPSPEPSVASATASLPEPSAAEPSLAPGALYLPNYRIDQATPAVPASTPRFSWRDFFRKPMPRFSDVFARFEEFGRSLESDWHVWLSLILLFAGFLALAENPPLIVLTIAFWIASAVVISNRRRPRHGPSDAQKPTRR